jgi:hypothetical protein
VERHKKVLKVCLPVLLLIGGMLVILSQTAKRVSAAVQPAIFLTVKAASKTVAAQGSSDKASVVVKLRPTSRSQTFMLASETKIVNQPNSSGCRLTARLMPGTGALVVLDGKVLTENRELVLAENLPYGDSQRNSVEVKFSSSSPVGPVRVELTATPN